MTRRVGLAEPNRMQEGQTNATAVASAAQPARVVEHSHQLARVIIWEVRRFRASRIFWLQALAFFILLLVVTWSLRMPAQYGTTIQNDVINVFVAGTSAWGLLHTLPTSLLLLVLLLPFITADGVTRDLQRRTHELVLTTVMPAWAYVWGRYLTGLLMGMGLAVLMLAAILGMGGLLHLTISDYPLPSTEALLVLWVGMVVPATILVASLGFALATLVPRHSTTVKVAILVAWIVGALVIPTPLINNTPPAWYVNWDPTSAVTARDLLFQYSIGDLLRTATNAAQFQTAFLSNENKMPTVTGWFVPHLVLGGLGLALILLIPLAFKRSRQVLA